MLDFKVYDTSGNTLVNFWQHDYGLTILVEIIDEDINEVHFESCAVNKAIIKPTTKTAKGYLVDVPDEVLKYSSPVNIYVYCRSSLYGVTRKKAVIPVRRRGVPTYESSGTTRYQDKTVDPSNEVQVVVADVGYTALRRVTVNTDPNLKAENIKYGTEIFGTTGTYIGSGTGGGDGAIEIVGSNFYVTDDNAGNVVIYKEA